MALSPQEETTLREYFSSIEKERRDALHAMFNNTKLKPRSHIEDAKKLATDAKDCAKKVAAVPGVSVPDLNLQAPNLDIFKGIDLPRLLRLTIPTLSIPDFDIRWIPDITLGRIPGFNLPKVRLNLKGILKFKDLLPDINLRALVFGIALKYPDLKVPAFLLDLGKIFEIDFDIVFPDLRLRIPEFFVPDLRFSLPHLNLPDVNFPDIPSIDVPTIDLGSIDLSGIHIPGIDLPAMLRVPGFDKILRLLFELFDVLDLEVIIAELGAEFLMEFISSALPIVQQVKAGAKIAANLGNAAMDWHKAEKTNVQAKFLLPGDAVAACTAIGTLLRNSRDERLILAAIQSAQLATSTAALFADLGTVSGPIIAAASAIATTGQKIMVMGARYKEMKQVNKLLAMPTAQPLTASIFTVSPLLGCYFIANSTTSNILKVLCEDLLKDGWMLEAERNKAVHMDPLIREAQRFIQESRYVLDPIRQSIGMHIEMGRMEKLKASMALYVKKKRGLAPATARAPTHKYIG